MYILKRMGKKPDGDYTIMLLAILNKMCNIREVRTNTLGMYSGGPLLVDEQNLDD